MSAALPRLHAEEQLDAIRAQGIAFGGYDEEDRKAMMEALHVVARGEAPEAEAPRPASPEALAAMGIGVVTPVPERAASLPSEKGVSDV